MNPAGNTGTTITAEDLFYNMSTRKRAMNGRDEFNKVAHVITCYALHNTGIAFSLKKSGEQGETYRVREISISFCL